MERFLLTLAVVAFFGLCAAAMWVGWRRKVRAHKALVPEFPEIPNLSDAQLRLWATGLYVSTTLAGQWQSRVVAHGVGIRTSATWRLFSQGLLIERVGAPDMWIPWESIIGSRVDKGMAGKVMGTDSLLIITWRLGDVVLDTGLLGDELEQYPQWIDVLPREENPRPPVETEGMLP